MITAGDSLREGRTVAEADGAIHASLDPQTCYGNK